MTTGHADQSAHTSLPHATASDSAQVQRATTSSLVPVRSLGRGAFAAVELVSLPVAQGKRKLLVCKKLLSQDASNQPSSAAAASNSHHEQQQQQPPQTQQHNKQQQPSTQDSAPPLKPSSLQDWSREVSMHRETAGCPFVLQLLAAKRCRAGNMLLLTEYASAGSLTDVLARLRLQQQRAKRDEQEHVFRRCQSAAAVLCRQGQQLGHEADTTTAAAAADGDADGVDAAPAPASAATMTQRDDDTSSPPSVLCAATSDGVAALCDALKDGHAPTAMLIHGVDVDVTAAAVQAANAAAAAHHHAGAAAASAASGGQGDSQQQQQQQQQRELPVGLCEESARFYTACILMGLQWLHSRRILHRDIKPCNLLLFSDGYVKLADLGCCCLLPPGIDSARTHTGTAQYMAPEVTCKKNTDGYSFPVDMWSLGVTLWQMVAGSLPDWAEAQQLHPHPHHQQHTGSHNHHQQQQQQQGGSSQSQHATAAADDELLLPLEPAATASCHTTPKDLQFPPQFSQELCELLTGLLNTDSSARLSIPEVQASSWFQGFDWQALSDKTLPPPELPAHALAACASQQQS